MDSTALPHKSNGSAPGSSHRAAAGGRSRDGAADSPSPSADGAFVYKMKDLCDKAGVSRQVVHFYIQQGLLPEGKKTGKNMAYYSELHLERLLLVRKLQHEHFLPLRAIRALLEERDEAFSPAQQRQLREVRAAMSESVTRPSGPRPTADVFDVAERLGLPRSEVEEMIEAGLFAVAEEQDLATGARRTVIARDDTWLLERYSDLRAAGLTTERGFRARDLLMFDEAMERLVAKEARLIAARTSSLPPAEAAALVERALPIVGDLLARLHAEKAKTFFATL